MILREKDEAGGRVGAEFQRSQDGDWKEGARKRRFEK
jgi:hypothetical protein